MPRTRQASAWHSVNWGKWGDLGGGEKDSILVKSSVPFNEWKAMAMIGRESEWVVSGWVSKRASEWERFGFEAMA